MEASRVVEFQLRSNLRPGPAHTRTYDFSLAEQLSTRELQVLSLVAEGMNNENIARRLSIRKPTIGSHLRNIFGKLGCNNRTEAAVKAIRLGIIK